MRVILTKKKYFKRLQDFGKVYDQLPLPFPKCDMVISYCFTRRIPKEVYLQYETINFHPAPSNFPGGDPYSEGAKLGVKKWGTTIFEIKSDEYDNGKIIGEKSFDIGYRVKTREELGALAHYYCYKMFLAYLEPQEFIVRGCG